MPPTGPHQTPAYMALTRTARTALNKSVKCCIERGGTILSLDTERELGITKPVTIAHLLDGGFWQVVRYTDADGMTQYGHRVHDPRLDQGGEHEQ